MKGYRKYTREENRRGEERKKNVRRQDENYVHRVLYASCSIETECGNKQRRKAKKRKVVSGWKKDREQTAKEGQKQKVKRIVEK